MEWHLAQYGVAGWMIGAVIDAWRDRSHIKRPYRVTGEILALSLLAIFLHAGGFW